MKLSVISAVLFAVALTGCPDNPSPKPPPIPDASDAASIADVVSYDSPQFTADAPSGSTCDRACAKMVAVGCRQLATCSRALQNAQDGSLIANKAHNRLPLKCDDLLNVASPTEVAANGWTCEK